MPSLMYQSLINTIYILGDHTNMTKKGMDFNVTQGMVLLLLKPINIPANLVLNIIIFITDPKNKIGY